MIRRTLAVWALVAAVAAAESGCSSTPEPVDPVRSTKATLDRGLDLARRGRREEALKLFEEALVRNQAEDNRIGVAYCLLNIGRTLFDLGRNPEAVAFLQQAQREAERADDDELDADIAFAWGKLAIDTGAPPGSSKERFDRARAGYLAAGARRKYALATYALGFVAGNDGNIVRANDLFAEAMTIAEQESDWALQGAIWRERGWLAGYGAGAATEQSAGQAEQHYRSALEAYKRAEQWTETAEVLTLIGRLFEARSNRVEAFLHYERAFNVNEGALNSPRMALDVENMQRVAPADYDMPARLADYGRRILHAAEERRLRISDREEMAASSVGSRLFGY